MFPQRQSRLTRRRWAAGLSCAVLAVGLTGCVTTTHVVGQMNGGPTARVQTKVHGTNAYSDAGPVSADDAVGTDPCEMRLQNIEAALLLYYSINRDLPQRLEDLIAISSDDLNLTCPVSNEEYLYIKQGFPVPGSSRLIIVCDATPAHGNKRWCITMAQSSPGAALELEPEELPESIFKGHRPSQ